ncbi:MAG: TlpA family protein disulfide reductase [Actinobacteria bacterium]|nr:TlpA family protein disulfide reductase [Actinomycetota bacterium]
MTRGQWAALAGAAVLVAGAFLVRADPEPAPDPRLEQLRAAADLEPCPQGLGPELPDLVLPCLGGGEEVDLRSAPPGRPTLVNVWATWCPPCVEEVPDLAAFAEKAGDRVGLVGVLTQDPARNGLEFARQYDMHWPSVVDDSGEVFRAFRPGPPVTLFLDAQGRVVHKRSGKFTDVAEIEALVAEHLDVQL